MAKRKKRATARRIKSKKMKAANRVVKRRVGTKSPRTLKKVTAKRSVKRTVGAKSPGTSKRVSPGTSKKRVARRKQPQTERMIPVVQGEIIDVVDEPMPGVVRVTEIETTRVTLPNSDDDEEE